MEGFERLVDTFDMCTNAGIVVLSLGERGFGVMPVMSSCTRKIPVHGETHVLFLSACRKSGLGRGGSAFLKL